MVQTGETGGLAVPALLSKSEFARFRGCSPAYVSKMIKEGKLAPPGLRPDGKIDVAEAVRMLGAPQTQLSPSRPPAAPETASPQYADERVRRERAQASLAELELAREQGRLVDREAYDHTIETRIRQLRDRILAVPREIAAECARLSEEIPIEARMVQALKKALTEVSQDGAATGDP